MRSCAIFDLDGTIIDNSSERVFLKYLLEGGELPLRYLSQWLFDFIRLRDLRQAKANKVYLKGLDYQYICNLAQICFKERLVDRISPKVFDLIEFHRAEGRGYCHFIRILGTRSPVFLRAPKSGSHGRIHLRGC